MNNGFCHLPVMIPFAASFGPSAELIETISKALALMANTLRYPKEHNPALVEAWTLALHSRGITPAEVMQTTAQLIAGSKDFPTPADFLEIARPAPDADTAAEAAWQAVLAVVRRVGRNGSLVSADLGNDGAALWSLERLGWQRLCGELGIGLDGKDNRLFFRSEFVRIYKLAAEGRMALDYLPGAMALENDAQGRRLTPALVGRPDWETLPAAALVGQGGPVEEFRGLRPEVFAGLAAAMGGSR